MDRARDILKSGLLPLVVAVAAGPIFIFPRGPWLWTLLAVPAIWAVRGILGLKWIRRTPLDAAIVLLLVWAFLGILGTPDVEASAAKIAGLAYGVVIFFALVEALKTEGWMKPALPFFLAAGALVAVIGILNPWVEALPAGSKGKSLLSPIPRIELKLERAETGINPNPVGGTMLWFLPLGFGIAGTLMKKKNGLLESRWRFPALALLILALAVGLVAVYLTKSFGTWIALAVVALMIGRRGRVFKALAGAAALVLFFVLILKPAMEAPQVGAGPAGSLIDSMSTRIPLWSGGLAIARDHPLFGVGMDRLRITPPFKYEDAHAHNQFIHTAAEMGLPALIAYLAILAGSGWMAVQVARSRMPPWMTSAMQGLVWGQVGFAIFGLADTIALGSKPGVFFWMSLAFMASIYLHGRDHGFLGKPRTDRREAS